MQEGRNYDKKISVMYIEEALYHPIEIRSVTMMYKLNVKLNKPIILSLYSLNVLKHIIEHKQCLTLILNIETLAQLKIVVPGYGVFNQKYELEEIGKFFKALLNMNLPSFDQIKSVCFEFPGWRAFTKSNLRNMMQFVRKCKYLEKFTFNLSHCVNLRENSEEHQDTYYGKLTFRNEQFETLLEEICMIRSEIFHKLELDFGAWAGINLVFFEILIHYLGVLNTNLKTLGELSINLQGWAQGNEKTVTNDTIDKFFRCFEDFTALQVLRLDLRSWGETFRVNRYKQRLQQIAGGAKKDENASTMYMFSMTGTYFGSQLKNKFKNLRVEILE